MSKNDMEEYWLEEFPTGLSHDQVIAYYDNHNGEYYDRKNEARYGGPRILAEHVAPYLNQMPDLENIIDVGAGSGYLGIELANLEKRIGEGVTMDALEPSQGMSDNAKLLNIYTNFYSDYVKGLNSTSIDSDRYDCVVSCGAFIPSHIPVEGILEMLRITKTGGLMAISMREAYITESPEYNPKLPALLKSLESGGNVRQLVHKTGVKGYFGEHDGVVLIYKKIIDSDIS